MKTLLLVLLLAVPFASAGPVEAARDLIQRVVPQHANEFVVELIPPADGMDVFEIESLDGKVVLRGDNGVSIASALNHYLKAIAHCQLTWCGDQLSLPPALPAVPAKIRTVCPHRYRVMFNYCTLSYSCAWWNWARWERELDFLAMNGINTPLGMVGIEGVWYNTLTKHGFTDEEALAFLVGPAFFAWQWMTNIEGHGGPLPKHWIDERVKLGQLWMARARELGMTPIQQGFSGNVPRLLKQKHPEAAIALQPSWCGFQGSAQLDPTDPLFNDCVYDMIWRNQAVEIDPWLTAYATRRYGAASAKADAAWQILLNDGPYKRGTSGVESSSMIAVRPALVVKKSGPNAGFRIPYPPLKLLEAAELLLQESAKLGEAQGYQYDVVDITRQILSNYTQELHKEIRLAYATKDKTMFAAKTAAFQQALLDVDTLLASRPEFLFGKMLADARAFGATPAESEQYAWNAAMQVTIWGPATDQAGESIRIFDYSWREWSGLIKAPSSINPVANAWKSRGSRCWSMATKSCATPTSPGPVLRSKPTPSRLIPERWCSTANTRSAPRSEPTVATPPTASLPCGSARHTPPGGPLGLRADVELQA